MNFFVQQDKDLSREQTTQKVKPVLFKPATEVPEIYFIVDAPLSNTQIGNLIKLIKNKFGFINIMVLNSIKFKASKKELTKTVVDFYYKHRFDFTKFIPPGSKIVTLGRAIYSITWNGDMGVSGFYDYITNDTSFYDPTTKSQVFPVDSYWEWFSNDTFKRFFALHQIEKAINYKFKFSRSPKINKVLIENTTAFFLEHSEACEVALDTETSGLNHLANEIGCLTVSFDGVTGYYLRKKDIIPTELNEFLKNKYQIWANGKFDCKFLWKDGVRNAHVDFDTLNAGHCLNEMRSNKLKVHSWLFTKYGGYENKLQEHKRKYKIKNYLDIREDLLLDYATMDAIVTFQVYLKMKQELKDVSKKFNPGNGNTLETYYYNEVIPSINMFIDIEYRGMEIDWDKMEEVSRQISKEMKEVKAQIYESFGTTEAKLNLNSGKQLGRFIEDLGWNNHGIGKEGYFLTNKGCMHKWKAEGHVEAELMTQYEELSTFMGTFVGVKEENTGFWQYRDLDNRIRSSFAVMLAKSGRNRSRHPNLQNIPKHSEKASKIRSFFKTPSEDYYISEFDAAGLQLRVAGIMSGDPVMEDIFKNKGGDMHSITTQSIFYRDLTFEEVVKRRKAGDREVIENRYKSKQIGFSYLFGTAAFTFASNSLIYEWSLDEVKEYVHNLDLHKKYESNLTMLKGKTYDEHVKEDVDVNRNELFDSVGNKEEFAYYWTVAMDLRKKFFEKYKVLAHWLEQQQEIAKELGYVVSPFGAIRRLPDLKGRGKDDRQMHIKNLRNISINSPVQNYEAVIIHRTMVKLHNYIKVKGYKSYFVGQVHDSMVMYLHKDEYQDIADKAKEFFSEDIPENKGIPMEMETEVSDYFGKGEYWGYGKSI